MKIGILTLFHGNYNWGGVLQGYALKRFLESNFPGVTADLLKYAGRKNVIYDSRIKQVLQYSPADVLKKILGRINRKNSSQLYEYVKKRRELFDTFMQEYMTNPKVYDDNTLKGAESEYDCLISGSDQVWNPNVGRAGYFQTMIDKTKCKKIAYAASIARDQLSGYEKKKMLPYITDFTAVSVREKTAKDFLNDYLKNKYSVCEVLDPVLMLTADQWRCFSEKSLRTFNGRFAVAFFFSDSLEYRKQISKYCKKNNLHFYTIPFASNEYADSELEGEGEKLFDLGPYEFITLFQNAECVFTDSFHGSVFSILFKLPFCVFQRDKNNRVSKNSRLNDLLGKFELSDRMAMSGNSIDSVMNKPIDYDKVDQLLQRFRKDSLQFLKSQLEN